MSTPEEKEILKLNLERSIPLFEKESAVVHSDFKKTLIATDIHGDLNALEFILKFAEEKEVDSYIFLGDYIDKGSESVAVLNTLLELKLKDPKKTILLRGNHETRGLSAWLEFGEDLVYHPELLDAANEFFEKMPIAAVLNNQIFCIHGCIAGSEDETPTDISKAEPKCYIWNDPGAEDGLTPSPRGNSIHRVGPNLISDYLKRNDLKLIIRGHTSHTEGVKYWFDGKLVSLYSGIHLDGLQVKAAVAIAKEDEIKFHYFRKTKNRFEWLDESEKMKLK
ncbi:hypothetical protein MmiEs2_08050 [Methanimicrococcus stummii]|uniref:Serine/threonine specific protein phosphatases domain-containing protein n=1 Tax=Methanimicrococcus stummii TaxID=3028294 RepID=A0AA96ZX69_9EURY|nr:metallophosphoesterase [Methanimicrococcus sp. Es2]WNY28609.1 hypothetical protein MmiEs2_08050 [Methanimicrococcus sp. Es2]